MSITLFLMCLHPLFSRFQLCIVQCKIQPDTQGYREQKGAEDVLLRVCSRFKHPWTAGSSNDVTLETNVAELIHTNEDWKASDVIEFLWYSLMRANNREDHLVRFSTDTFADLEQRRHMLQLVQRSIKENKLEVHHQQHDPGIRRFRRSPTD